MKITNGAKAHQSAVRIRVSLLAASAIAIVIGTAIPVLAGDVTVDRLANAANDTSNVLMNGAAWQAQRFSQLKEINAENVGGLVPAWVLSFGDEKM